MKVSNPLTIIAIFSGVAETIATVALVQLPLAIQEIFVYFVIAFPSGIVVLFFAILYFKNTVLYAPSDYDNQSHYLEANKIKQAVTVELENVFSKINEGGMRLSKEEIERAKSSVSLSIDNETHSAMANNIIDFLNDGPASTQKIAKVFGLTISNARTIMRRMEGKELVLRESAGKLNTSIWSKKT